MIKSPLRYPGGKSRAVKFLINYIPKFNEFREPFFGGGSLSFHYVQKSPNATFYASDINYDLFCFWNQLKTKGKEVIEEVLNIKHTISDGKKLFYDLLEKRNGEMTDFQRAVDFFILNRITFSGVVDSGGYSAAAFKGRFTLSSIDRLETSIQIIKNINISNLDYTNLLEKDGKDVFIFLDPPYSKNKKSKLYGKKGKLHTSFDHEKLFKDLKNCKHNWLITYDNNDELKDLYKDYHIIDWELQYGMNNYKKKTAEKGKEILIANYDLNKCFKSTQENYLLFT